jgi:hypothetical protein
MLILSGLGDSLPRLGDAFQHDAVGFIECDLCHLAALFGFGSGFSGGKTFRFVIGHFVSVLMN